jgi:diadenosine tetraphosphate (Ap4A) HIT family hydrolase
VLEDDLCVAFMSINPLADGHVLVIPRAEVDHWIDLPSDLSAHLFAVSHRISNALAAAFPCERVGMIIAGYEVNHCHIHLVPTTDMSQLDFRNAARTVERERLEANAARIIAALG